MPTESPKPEEDIKRLIIAERARITVLRNLSNSPPPTWTNTGQRSPRSSHYCQTVVP